MCWVCEEQWQIMTQRDGEIKDNMGDIGTQKKGPKHKLMKGMKKNNNQQLQQWHK